jgi:hypothetical protein
VSRTTWTAVELRSAVGDRNALRAMIQRVFPNLAIHPPEHRLDHHPARFCWDGPTKDAPAPDAER